jgi:ribosomal protein L28
MGSRSRAFALVAVVAACAPVIAVRAASSSTALRVACGQKSFFVAFYPKGEPGERRPHVTLFTRRQTLGLIFPKQLSFARACKPAADAQAVWDGGPARTTRKRIVLRCTVSRGLLFKGAAVTGRGGILGNRLSATLGRTRKTFLRALVSSRASVRYDPRYCKKRASPATPVLLREVE